MKTPFYILFILILFCSCKKEKEQVSTTIAIAISHMVDDQPLQYNTFNYTNAAGNSYEVTSLRYYLSNFVFHNSDGSQYADTGIYYIDANNASTTAIQMAEVPTGNYNGVSFKLGLTPAQNISNSLPNLAVNNNMSWPDQMGGGYHFLKFEGHFNNNSGQTDGFAIHLGTDVSLVNIDIDQLFEAKDQTTTLNLSMNLNEWFANPSTLDLDSLSYTMGNASGMSLVATNGSDVFTIE